MPMSTHTSQNVQLRSFPFSYYIAHQDFSNYNMHAEHAGVYVANKDSDSVNLGWGLRFCLPHKLPGDAAATNLWTIFHVGAHHSLSSFKASYGQVPCRVVSTIVPGLNIWALPSH